mmetsp:Transcript_61294/g.179128  ORF Transcript_61294/g.179128 Transcript_61294/m.179128 type:complete len:209 (+) Transcript_61294:1732-2358(+)
MKTPASWSASARRALPGSGRQCRRCSTQEAPLQLLWWTQTSTLPGAAHIMGSACGCSSVSAYPWGLGRGCLPSSMGGSWLPRAAWPATSTSTPALGSTTSASAPWSASRPRRQALPRPSRWEPGPASARCRAAPSTLPRWSTSLTCTSLGGTEETARASAPRTASTTATRASSSCHPCGCRGEAAQLRPCPAGTSSSAGAAWGPWTRP